MNSAWRGSTDPAVKSGVATFDGIEIPFYSFEDYRKVDMLLNDAKFQGKISAANEIRAKLQQTIDSIAVSKCI